MIDLSENTGFFSIWALGTLSPSAIYNLGLLLLLATMLVVGLVAYRLWQEMQEEDEEPATKEEIMEAFEQARDAGELEEEEFARLKRRVEETGDSSRDTSWPLGH